MFTDRKMGAIRVMTPVKSDGAVDGTRKVLYVGETQLLTAAGLLPLVFELDASSLATPSRCSPRAPPTPSSAPAASSRSFAARRHHRSSRRIAMPGLLGGPRRPRGPRRRQSGCDKVGPSRSAGADHGERDAAGEPWQWPRGAVAHARRPGARRPRAAARAVAGWRALRRRALVRLRPRDQRAARRRQVDRPARLGPVRQPRRRARAS